MDDIDVKLVLILDLFIQQVCLLFLKNMKAQSFALLFKKFNKTTILNYDKIYLQFESREKNSVKLYVENFRNAKLSKAIKFTSKFVHSR